MPSWKRWHCGAWSQVARFLPCVYKGHCVGEYLADLLVEDRVLVELKCVDKFSNEHLAQCINYLKASHLRLAQLINFQKPKVEWKRIIYGFVFIRGPITPMLRPSERGS